MGHGRVQARHGRGDSRSAIIVAPVNRAPGVARHEVVSGAQGLTLSDAIAKHVEKARTTVHTDGHGSSLS